MITLKDVFTDYKIALRSLYDDKEAEAISLLTISEICGLSKAQVKAFPEKEISEEDDQKLSTILIQLKVGTPVQYALGHTEFYGLQFLINPSVLIPRPETEELVEWALSSIKGTAFITKNILDIGTGSGCIAVALKKNLPEFNVSAVDISIEALATARSNAQLNNVTIEFIEADILNHSSFFNDQYMLIISNPPYVTLTDKLQMHLNVTNFEPHTALFVPENDPLIFYKAIVQFATHNLVPGGFLFFEINENFGKETVDLLKDKGFKNIELKKDMSNRDRMLKALKPQA